MKRLLLVLVLIVVAFSGCTEKSPSVADKSAAELKTLSVAAAENLTSYSIKSSMTQTLKLDSGNNATAEKSTTITENAETVAVVNLSSLEAHATGSTQNQMEMTGQPANTSTTSANVYQIGNSTYVNDESGNWTHLADPRSMQEVWGPDRNNQVKAIAATFNLSTTKDLGSEAISGEDAYKLMIVTGSGDQINLQNAAFAIAAKVTQYPMYLPSVNRTELNETGKIEKTIWISKKSYLPVKYQSTMGFTMTPEIIGGLDPSTSQMKMFNQSIRLGEISVSIVTDDQYYDFDKPTDIIVPEQALSAPVITPTQVQMQADA
jgi:outer membrane lipoprotein-sorting protein